MRRVVISACAILLSASVSPARADVETGVLECRGVSQQYVIASITNLQCLFRSNVTGRTDAYAAVIRRGGLDIGFNQSTALAWAVFSPTTRVGPGSLAGVYVGASANATVGLGVGANALFGGSNRTVSLQPVSVQGQTGLGAVGGISALELQPVVARRHRGR
jgi:hypothetical protein